MTKAKQSTKQSRQSQQAKNVSLDGKYLLKLVLYILLGSTWLKLGSVHGPKIALPIGFAVGLYLATRDRFQIDRKIEYAALVVAMLVGFIGSYGLYVSF